MNILLKNQYSIIQFITVLIMSFIMLCVYYINPNVTIFPFFMVASFFLILGFCSFYIHHTYKFFIHDKKRTLRILFLHAALNNIFILPLLFLNEIINSDIFIVFKTIFFIWAIGALFGILKEFKEFNDISAIKKARENCTVEVFIPLIEMNFDTSKFELYVHGPIYDPIDIHRFYMSYTNFNFHIIETSYGNYWDWVIEHDGESYTLTTIKNYLKHTGISLDEFFDSKEHKQIFDMLIV